MRLGLQHGLVRVIQIFEVSHERVDSAVHVNSFEHVLTNEVGEIADRLHRHRLVKQVESLLSLDAKSSPKCSAVGGKRIVYLDARHRSQVLLQCIEV